MDDETDRTPPSPQPDNGTPAQPTRPSRMDGDIEAEMPASIPEMTAPLSVRPDTDSISHSHTVVHHSHADSLLQPSQLTGGGEATAQTIYPGALTVEHAEDPPGSARLGPAEFAVTLPMDSRVKDDYERVLAGAAADLREFLDSFLPGTQVPLGDREYLWPKMQELVEGLNNTSVHPDLNVPLHLSEGDSSPQKEASWAEYSSAKFLLLGHLIEMASDHDLHLILAVQDDRKQALIERYLLGKGFAYTRAREAMDGGLEVSLAKGPLSFGIHSNENVNELLKAPSAIFAFDAAFNAKSPSVQHIRTTYTRNEGLLPVVWLLVANSCEHVVRCLPDLPPANQMRALVLHTARLHDEVGDLQEGAFGVRQNAEEILHFLLDSFASWSLPAVEPLDFVSTPEMDSSASSSDGSHSGDRKRSLVKEDTDGHASKRARVGIHGASRPTGSSFLEQDLAQVRSAHAAEKEKMQTELADMQARLQATEKALGILQHRYESRTQELHKMRQERDRTAESKSSLEQRIEKHREDISKLKDERAELKHELEAARQELKTGGGTLGDLEAAREEIRRLTKEIAGLERKADYEKNQAEYTREQYQNASTVAAQAGNELRQVRSQNEELTRKTQANANQLRETNMKNDSARHLARIQELELSLAARDDLLRRKEEELREIRKNRPSTRSTSTQPRSPKWAAGSRPTSPGITNNGNGGNGNNGLAGRGSALRFSSDASF
ncbi:hypothetical protein N7512_003141 [Penicillium capsulatum]|nr:hypothetical protein N7512_003141 [Penicillium capsulatum]